MVSKISTQIYSVFVVFNNILIIKTVVYNMITLNNKLLKLEICTCHLG